MELKKIAKGHTIWLQEGDTVALPEELVEKFAYALENVEEKPAKPKQGAASSAAAT